MTSFDVIVIGGGHAGVEAAAAAARMGAETALVSQSISTIGAMSCNPAIGGLGKGHLVREVDAMDGLMGRAADLAGIQFRVLNRSKGSAVQGPRVQADRRLYRAAIVSMIRATRRLTLIEGECMELKIVQNQIEGIKLRSGQLLKAKSVVLTAGTFLNGVVHIGTTRFAAGRFGDDSVTSLARQIRSLGVEWGRLKTGTPPRLDGKSIDYSSLSVQWGDESPEFLSCMTTRLAAPQTACYITRTNVDGHEAVRRDLQRTAVYSGAISGAGPRYCPSIEDKVVRFPDRESHQIFLEPEGLDNSTIYPNGISTSLPIETQQSLVRSIHGLKQARILRPGYAIEYDYVNPRGLESTLMLRFVLGLFFAGQINGTTGYEEAAAQGLVAGINAALFTAGREMETFRRTDSYTGVMIDDLVTRGVTEPYRMFTSRAEYRLSLRTDNADERLTPIGLRLGVIGANRNAHFSEVQDRLRQGRYLLNSLSATKDKLVKFGLKTFGDGARRSAFELASIATATFADLVRVWPELGEVHPSVRSRLRSDAQYASYVFRQQRDIERHIADEQLLVPRDMDFTTIPGLSNELKKKFAELRPRSIGQAGRIEGVTPAALMLLAAHARRRSSDNGRLAAEVGVSRETVD